MEPAIERLFGGYPNCLCRGDACRQTAGQYRGHGILRAGRALARKSKRSSRTTSRANYTHALRYIVDRQPNVVAQLLARNGDGAFSLSSNTDITIDLLRARSGGEADFLFAGEINSELPYMPGTAECPAGEIDVLLDDPATDFALFSAVKRPVSLRDQAVGLHVSRLVPDGGTLQIGIGSIGDAIARALQLRHSDNDLYRSIVSACPFPAADHPRLENRFEPFDIGLYSVSEMLVDGLLQLFETGILKRVVDGVAIHAGFFVESRDFYRRLREMVPERLSKIAMMPVSFTNELYGNEREKIAARKDARFVNNAMKTTLLGAAASDSDDRGRLVSGEGGQFNFVAQAFALPGARSVITINATRRSRGKLRSNIVWEHPYPTVPRHYRDIVVSEYGISDLRGRSDEDCVKSMLCIADSRFQRALADQAKAAGKLAADWVIPARFRHNTPERLALWLDRLRQDGVLAAFPFGTDFSQTEQRLLSALQLMDEYRNSPVRLAFLAWQGLGNRKATSAISQCLERMRLDQPKGIQERLLAVVLKGALRKSGDRH